MEILKILNSNDGGGVLRCETQYIKKLRELGITVDAVIIGKAKSFHHYTEIVDNYIECPEQNISFSGGLKKITKNLCEAYSFGKKNSKLIRKKIQDIQYNAIIFRNPKHLFLAGILNRELSSTVYWHMPCTVNHKVSKIFYNLFLRIYNIKPIANSKYTQKTIGNICRNVIYPGFDPERVSDGVEKYRKDFKIEEGVPVYGIAARITPSKAQDIVVKAFMESEAIAKNGHLLLAGDYDCIKYFNKVRAAAGNSLGANIHYLGRISDMDNFFASIDVMINGRINAEPFGISVAESLGAGVPVIAYNLGGPQEMIANDETGWLIDTPDVNNYKESINQSLVLQKDWKAMGKQAIKSSDKYNVDTNVSKLIELIE